MSMLSDDSVCLDLKEVSSGLELNGDVTVVHFNYSRRSSFFICIMNKIGVYLSRFTWFQCERTGCTFNFHVNDSIC